MTVPTHKVNQGDEIEITYQLDYNSAEVKRLSDPKLFSHVTTLIHSAEGMPPSPSTQYFSVVSERVAVTVDDQKITFKTRAISIPLELHQKFLVTAGYSDSTGAAAAGEKPVELLEIEIQRPGFGAGETASKPAAPQRV